MKAQRTPEEKFREVEAEWSKFKDAIRETRAMKLLFSWIMRLPEPPKWVDGVLFIIMWGAILCYVLVLVVKCVAGWEVGR